MLQLKSKVWCLTYQYTSVKFDPFTFLSLPLPVESKVTLEVIGNFDLWNLCSCIVGWNYSSLVFSPGGDGPQVS